YTGSSVTNYDYQDNVYIISNIRPVSPPTAPTGLTASSSGAGISLSWSASTEGNTLGYNVYRSSSSGGAYTLLNATPITQNSFVDAFAPVGQVSFYRVTAVNVHGTESAPATVSATRTADTVPPATPRNLTASGTPSGISLNWDDNTEPDLAGYNIYRATSSGGPFTRLNTSGLRGLSDFIDTTAPVGATSFYRVSAVDGSGNESSFATVSAFRPVSGNTPASATNVSATPLGVNSVRIDWTDNSGNELGFRIERRLQSSQSWTTVGQANINATSFTDETVSGGTAYAYRVIAFNSFGDAPASNEATVATPSNGPAAPVNLVATAQGKSVIQLAWTDNSDNESGFRVERKTGASGTWTTIATVGANTTTYSAGGLLEGTTYFFRVIAFNNQGESLASNEAGATTTSQFTSVDIGNALPPGSTQTVTNDRDYNLHAGGADIWGNSDSFRFAYKQLTGDFDVVVLITGVTNTHPTAQAGLMARASLSSSAMNVMQRTDASNRFRFAYRASTGGTTTATGSLTHPTGQGWLRLTRVGNTFTGYSSTDGVNWTQTGTVSLDMGATLFVGLAASSKNASMLNTVQYRNYNDGTQPAPTVPAAPGNLTADAATPGRVTLTWTDNSDNESGFLVQRRQGSGEFDSGVTVAADGTTFVDTSVQPSTTYTYRVTAFNAAGSSTPVEVTVTTPAPPVQDGSTSTNIGGSFPGSTIVVTANRDYDVSGAGVDIFGTADSFRFVHFSRTGDFDMRVRIDELTGPAGQVPQAGLMARDTLNANSRHVNIRFDGASSVMMKWRTSTGGTTSLSTKINNITAPVWLRLTRSGNVFTGFYSLDGTNWVQVGTVTFSMPTTVFAGMTALSKTTSETATARFREFAFA
ncbi:MAG: fibronectin type III domain-containing protein, partial [Phycisphaerae bacterium]|nr:fibronectin type III domain-containing protein [Phycisphaerae bacterium]